MAVPVIASIATKEDAANTTSRTISKPSGAAAGDWLVLIVGCDGTATITTSDFTTIYDSTDSIDSSRFRLAVRKVDGTEGASFTIGTSASEQVNAWLGRITGVDSGITSGTLIDALSVCKATAEQNKAIAPAIWTETDDCLIIAAYTQDGGVANAAATGIPSGYTESHQDAGLAAGVGISVVYKSATTAGAVGQPVWTCSTGTDEYVAVQFAIRSTTTLATAPAHPIPKCSVVNLCSSASSTFDVVLELPYGCAQNDGLILEVASESTSTTIPGDFTQIQKSNTGGFIYFENAYFVADGSMPSSYSVSCSATAAKTAALHLFKNIDTADFPHKNAATSGGAADTAPTAPSVTTTKDNCLIWRAFGADDDDLTVGSGFFGSTTGVFSGVTGANGDISQQAAYSTLASAGSAGTAAATLGAAEDWVATTLAIAPEAATDATITGGSGSYSIAGQTASLEYGALVSATAGSYAITGAAASLEYGAEVAAEAGSYPVSGSAASLESASEVNADAGSYAIAGQDVTLSYEIPVDAEAGAYAVAGQDAALEYGAEVNAEAGNYPVSGTAAGLEFSAEVNADAGSYAVAGQDATLIKSTPIDAEAGAYSYTGQDAALEYGAEVAAEAGSYPVTGQVASLVSHTEINADTGGYGVSGMDATLTYASAAVITAEAGAIAVTGSDAGLLAGYLLGLESSAYGIAGSDVDLAYTQVEPLPDTEAAPGAPMYRWLPPRKKRNEDIDWDRIERERKEELQALLHKVLNPPTPEEIAAMQDAILAQRLEGAPPAAELFQLPKRKYQYELELLLLCA